MIPLLKKLVKIDTTNPPGRNYGKIVDVLEKECRKRGLKTKRVKAPHELWADPNGDERINLLAEWDVGAKQWLHLNGHYDVVPVTNNWKTEPFKPVLKGDKLYGRGAWDDKAQFAVYLQAIKELKAEGIKPKVNIQISFVPDEETGGKAGFLYLVNQKLVKADYAVGEGYPGTVFQATGKGTLHMRVSVKGKSAHAAHIHTEDNINAFERAMPMITEFQKLKQKIVKRKSTYPVMTKGDEFATMMIGGEVRGGNKVNTVPDIFTFTIDRRYLPEEDSRHIKKELLDIIKKARAKDKQLKIEVEIMGFTKPVKKSKRLIQTRMASAIKKVHGVKGKGIMICGGTDMNILSQKGIPAIGHSPVGANEHADDEWVSVKSLEKTKDVFKELIKSWR